MSHAREQIRDLIVTSLIGLTTAGARVNASRVYPYKTLPAINVATSDDEVVDYTTGAALVANHELIVTIEARVKIASEADDQLDDICAEVETAIGTDRTLGGAVKDMLLQTTTTEIDGGEEHLVGIATMNFLVTYRIDVSDPTTMRG